MATARDLPDRAAPIRLLVSIGTEAIERYDHAYMDYGGEESNHPLAADLIRDQAELFISFAGSGNTKPACCCVVGGLAGIPTAAPTHLLVRRRAWESRRECARRAELERPAQRVADCRADNRPATR